MLMPTEIWIAAAIMISVAGLAVTSMIIKQFKRPARTRVITTLPPPCAGALARLDFTQSMDPVLFAGAVEAEALAYAGNHIPALSADGTNLTLQALRQWCAQSETVVAASHTGALALGAGNALLMRHGETARRMPVIVNAGSRQTEEIMKEVSLGRKAVAGAAATATIAVSLAHMISAADIARTLKLVDSKLDLLLAYRRIDQSARLERIYTSARELLAAPLNDARQMEVWRLRGELRELRATWRNEIEHHLAAVRDPNKDGWFDWLLTRQSTYDNENSGKFSEGQLRLALMEYALRLDRLLAAATGTWDVSAKNLADEVSVIARIGTLMREKAALISEERRGNVAPLIAAIEDLTTHYRSLLPSLEALDLEPAALTPAPAPLSASERVG